MRIYAIMKHTKNCQCTLITLNQYVTEIASRF